METQIIELLTEIRDTLNSMRIIGWVIVVVVILK